MINNSDAKIAAKSLIDFYKTTQSPTASSSFKTMAFQIFHEIIREYSWRIEAQLTPSTGKCKKYTSQKYWSKAAVDKFLSLLEEKSSLAYALKFEHVVPNKVLTKTIVGIINSSISENEQIEKIANILQNQITICVITPEEDDMLNKSGLKDSLGFDENGKELELTDDTIWNRYKEVGEIDVNEVKWSCDKNVISLDQLSKIIL